MSLDKIKLQQKVAACLVSR